MEPERILTDEEKESHYGICPLRFALESKACLGPLCAWSSEHGPNYDCAIYQIVQSIK